MPPRQVRFSWRVALFAATALGALSVGAAAKDLPASPEGAQKLDAFFAAYLGKPAAGDPATFTVTPEGADYLVALDIGALLAPLKNVGDSYDAAVVKFKAFEQDDGAWRVEQSDFPTITVHSKLKDVSLDSTMTLSGLKNVMVIDPAISWVRSGQASSDKLNVRAHGPGVDETLDFGAMQATIAGQASAEGALSTGLQETLGAIAFTMAIDLSAMKPDASAGAKAKPVNIAARANAASVDAKLDGLKPRPLLDLWAYLVSHPTRAELAADEARFKALLTAMLASQLSFDEDLGMEKVTVQTPQGLVTADSAKVALGGAAAGSASRFEEHFSASGVALTPGLAPAMFHDLIPTSFDIGFKVNAFDLTAAGAEAIADLRLAGDAPPISAEDDAKVWAKLLGAGPVLIEVPPSHVVAPQLDIAFEGQVRYQSDKPTGTFTVHMRHFDKTMAALKGLGPATEGEIIPFLAIAKGMAKTEADGALTWVGELGADGMMEVNGLPLGKAPI